MKKGLLSGIYFLACTFSIQAQVLFGTTYKGGTDGGGTINKFMPATNNLIVAKSFESLDEYPTQNVIQASDGKLYGMTKSGGSNGYGVIFSFDPSVSVYTKLKDFDNNANGGNPVGSLIQASDGKLYGMAGGGSNGYGVIFSFDPSSSIYTKLKDFDNTNGGNPAGNLIQASDGKLYGMAGGGSNGFGVIFSFDPSSSIYTKLKDFNGTDGSYLTGSLIQAGDGKLYGMTTYGGSNSYGVIFSFDPSSSSYTKLKDFDAVNGGNPRGRLVQASNGKLYGVASGGSNGTGIIFSFALSSSTYTKEIDGTDGSNSTGSLLQASDGKLYGMAGVGSFGAAVIFSFDPLASIYTKLKDLDGTNFYPSGSLVQASDGKLYGITTGGGSLGAGVIFSFDPAASTYAKLKDFGTNETGATVSGSVVQASNGKLYGTTQNGGSKGLGVIFSFDPSSSTYTKLKDDFDYTNGARPFGNLVQASNGKLYGTAGGGSNGGGYGVIFSFDPSSSTYSKLYDFENDGVNPTGGLIQASDGKLYGTTSGARNLGYGGIFSFDPLSSTYTEVYSSTGSNGIFPSGGLVQASDGKLYGMMSYTNWLGFEAGGSGVIFSYDPLSSIYKKLKDFDGTDGANPLGSLIQASDGKLYGITTYGGNSNVGVIFSFDPSSSSYIKLKDFETTDGTYPTSSLMQASDGKLYGSTGGGGSNGYGVIFSVDPSSSFYSKLQDYNGINGANAGAAFIELKQPVTSYCNASGVCSNKGFIKNVFACYSFNNTTGCTGYGDYTAKAVNTAAGRLLGFSVTPGYNSCAYEPPVYVRAWIDWNGDGDFTDAGEMVFAPHTAVNVKSKFWVRVPAGTPAGKKRMRVAVSDTYKFGSCGTIANGEVEDYTINVLAARFAVPDATPDAFDEAGDSFTIYPNPIQQKMIVERAGYDEGKANNTPALMVLTNASGKTLMQSRLVNLVQAVDMSKLASGIYFVTIINGKNKTTNKIIINR